MRKQEQEQAEFGGGGVVNFNQKFRVHRLFPLVARTIMHADRLGSKLRD